MSSEIIPNLDAPGGPISLLHVTDPSSMVFIHRGQTHAQLVKALLTVVQAPLPRRSQIYLLASEFEVVITFLVCSIMLYKKRSLGKLWIIIKRESINGTFYVANAVFVLVLGVSAYLISWDITALIIAAFSFANVSSMEWWWVIPLPWLPLVLCAYVSIHGFAVGCSPRSPLSSLNSTMAAARQKWYYLPIPKSPTICNLSLILPCVLFIISTIALICMSGRNYYHAKRLAHQLLSPEILHQMKVLVHDYSASFPGDDLLASDELVWIARKVAASYFETHRYVCINLAVFAACAYTLNIPVLVYGLPNCVSLVDHACSRYSEPLPPTCNTFYRKLWFLLTEGKPKAENSSTQLNLGTWKMTILAIGYVLILVICVPAFAWLPVYIISETYPRQVLMGDIRTTMNNAVLAVSVVTILSCSFVAVFCTVATLDPLFRAAIGLNVIRTQIPIDIHVTQHRSRHEEVDPISPTFAFKGEGPTLRGLHQGHDPTITPKPSMSTLHSAKLPFSKGEKVDPSDENHIHFAVTDLEAGHIGDNLDPEQALR